MLAMVMVKFQPVFFLKWYLNTHVTTKAAILIVLSFANTCEEPFKKIVQK